jgi:hypothetical protein
MGGIANEVEKDPVLSAVTEAASWFPKRIVMASDAPKPLPLALICVPTEPRLVDSEALGTTVKVVVAPPASIV